MSAECKHGRYFPDGDECCGLCAGEEINALKARIAELERVVAGADTYCAVCGGTVKLNDLKAMAEHVARCPNHPSHALRAEVAALKARVAELTEPRFFPIQDGPAIPWAAIAPHERQAQRNHDQSLEELARRGGLDPAEAVAVLEDRRWRSMPADEALALLKELAGWMPPEEAKAVVANCLAAVKLRNEVLHREEQLREETNVLRQRVFTDQEMDAVHNCVRHGQKCSDALKADMAGWVCTCGCTAAIRIILSKPRGA